MFRNIRRTLKFSWQLITRGWDDSDTWVLDYTIAKFALPRLRLYKGLTKRHPIGLTEQEWDDALDKMIYAMRYHAEYDKLMGAWESGQVKTQEDYQEKVQAGLDLFAKHFHDLWWQP